MNSVATTAAKGFKAFTWPDQVNVNWLLQRNSTTIGLGAATALNKVWGTNGGSGAGLTALIATSTPSSLFSGANPLGMNPWPRPGDTLASIPGLFRGNAPDGSQPMVGSPLLPTM
ncbi:MAG: hypothetical protein FJ077_12195 [Cyanobacteria bacterium K_DeepCast_35m_m2_023]|nr:hypothetical protein [Cyanobacteria bacterium K_DeepCast_35m_m2_023]